MKRFVALIALCPVPCPPPPRRPAGTTLSGMPRQNPLNLTMTADTARGVATTVGPAGGTFQASGANGDIYKLTIAEGALFTDTSITIWPVASAEGMP